ncbi:MAG: HDOD domain-containing protein [Ignavibacteria bacterium]
MQDQDMKAKRERTELVLTNIYNLPSMSGHLFEISKLLDDPTTNTHSLGKMIGKDQGIATKILSIANSPLYGLRRKVTTIDFSILVIGFSEMKKIVLALSMMESFKNKTDKYLDQKEFWLHSTLTGSASKRIADDLGFDCGGEAFVAGLLHDLGISVIHKYFHSDFIEIYKKVTEEGKSFVEAEVEQLGYTHADIGYFLCDKWNLPEELCDTIRYHQQPEKSDKAKVVTSIVHLVDYMTQQLKKGNFYWDENISISESALSVLKLGDKDGLNKFVNKYDALFDDEIKSIVL